MKKILFFLSLAMISCGLFGQITLTTDDFLQPNTQIMRYHANVGSLQPGPAGANQTWDFSSLAKTGETESLTLKNPADTPHAGTFPQATLAEEFPQEGGTAWTFWKLDNSEYTFVGLIAVTDEGSLTVPYSDFQEIFDMPVNFGDSHSDTFAATFQSFGAQVNRTGNSTTSYDGYGTLILPGGTINNVARLLNVQHIEDTVSVAGQSITTITDTTSYTWHIKGEPWPVLTYSIIENTTNVGGIVNTISETTIRFQDLDGSTNPEPQQNRWVSHLTSPTGGFQTNLFMLNNGNSSADVTLQPYDNSGDALAAKEVSIPAGNMVTVDAGTYFDGAAVSHFSINGSENVIISTGYKAAQGEGATAHLHEAAATGTTFKVYPGERGVIFDGMALVNTGDGNATITGSMTSESGETLASVTLTDDLAPGAKFLQVFESVFPDNLDSVIEINSNQPLSVLFLRGSTLGNNPAYLYANNVQTTPGDDRWIPHVTRFGGGFQTRFYFDNNSGGQASITLQPYAADGSTFEARTVSLGGGSLDIRTHEELFGSDDVSHFSISGSKDILVSTGYRSVAEEGATAHVHEAPETGRVFRVFPGERNLVFDGMAIVNTGNGPANIQAEQISSTGQVVASEVLTDSLAVNAKYLNVFDALFADIPGTTIRITSDQDLSVIFLRGTPVGVEPAYLYANPAIEQ